MAEEISKLNQAIIVALQRLAEKNGGLLRPDDIIEAARPASSPLHNKFTWDDTVAAHKWRLEQARALLRVTVHYLTNDTEAVRVFVSLTPDRDGENGGYRRLVSVMSDKELRQQLLDDAMDEMQRFREKYKELKELAEVFAAMSAAQKRKIAA